MSSNDALHAAEIIDARTTYSFRELCDKCRLPDAVVLQYLRYEVIMADGPAGDDFSHQQLHRLRKASRLQHDLEISLQSIAFFIDLIEANQELKARIRQLESELPGKPG